MQARNETHGQVVVGDAVAVELAADAQEGRAAGGAVVVQELEVPHLESPVILQRQWPVGAGVQQFLCNDR